MANCKSPNTCKTEPDSKLEDDSLSHACKFCNYKCQDDMEFLHHQKTCRSEEDEKHITCDEQDRYSALSVVDRLNSYPVYRCEQCEYETFSLATLSSHRKTHNVKKLFQCDVCHMKFSQAANMRRHRMRHTGIKPFECRVCAKRFFRKDHLMEHMVTHSKQLPFQCPVCGRSFHRQVHLKEHISGEHSGVVSDRICGICGYKAATSKGAKLHFTTRHARNNNIDNGFNMNTISMSLVTSTTVATNAKHFVSSSDVASPEPPANSSPSSLSTSTLVPVTSNTPVSLFEYMHSDPGSKLNSIADSPIYPNLVSLMVESSPLKLPRLGTSPSRENHFAAASLFSYHCHGLPKFSKSESEDKKASLPVIKKESSSNGDEVAHQPASDEDYERCSSISVDAGHSSASPDDPLVMPDSSRSRPSVDVGLSESSASSTLPMLVPFTSLCCRYCGIIYPDRTLYFLHKGLHSEADPWKCNMCGEVCNDKYDFNVHVLSKAHQ